MAVMLRTLGVPTRNVTGFVGGTYNRFGKFYAVRQGDAHSWVEVFIDEAGWMTFDPTPPADAAPGASSPAPGPTCAISWERRASGGTSTSSATICRSRRASCRC
jgi:transglutaminase-like putative cysteine protease